MHTKYMLLMLLDINMHQSILSHPDWKFEAVFISELTVEGILQSLVSCESLDPLKTLYLREISPVTELCTFQISAVCMTSALALMHLSIYCPTTPPPLRPKWGFTGGIDTKLLPHCGAFDKGIEISFKICHSSHVKSPCCNWGLCGAVLGFDTLSLPH